MLQIIFWKQNIRWQASKEVFDFFMYRKQLSEQEHFLASIWPYLMLGLLYTVTVMI